MNRSNLLAAMCLELFPELFCVRIGWEEVHLTVLTTIHLAISEAAFDLHVLYCSKNVIRTIVINYDTEHP